MSSSITTSKYWPLEKIEFSGSGIEDEMGWVLISVGIGSEEELLP